MYGSHGFPRLQLTNQKRRMEPQTNPLPALGLNAAALALSFSGVEQGLRIAGLVFSVAIGAVTLYRMLK